MKHFLANSNETTRGSSSSDFDQRLFREYYALPFRLGFLAGARSFMAAYNAMNHVPMTVNEVLRTVVVDEWNVDGIISSDARAIPLMVTGHKFFGSNDEALGASIRAGINQILWPRSTSLLRSAPPLTPALSASAIWTGSFAGSFVQVIRLGLLDPPAQVPYSNIGASDEPAPWNTEQHKAVARDVANESIVLLKNGGATLPLNKASLRNVAVIGRFANQTLIDLYGGPLPYSTPVLDAIRSKLGDGRARQLRTEQQRQSGR